MKGIYILMPEDVTGAYFCYLTTDDAARTVGMGVKALSTADLQNNNVVVLRPSEDD